MGKFKVRTTTEVSFSLTNWWLRNGNVYGEIRESIIPLFHDGDDFIGVDCHLTYFPYSTMYGEAHYIAKVKLLVASHWRYVYIKLNASDERIT